MAKPIFPALPLATAGKVLDVGAGTGSMLPDIQEAAPQARIFGVDRAEGMLRIAKDAGWKNTIVSDAQQLGVRSMSIDVGLLIFTLFHFPDPIQGLREVERVLRPGGRLGIVCWGTDPGAPGAAIWTEELNNAGAGPDPRDSSIMQVGLMNSSEKLENLIRSSGLAIAHIWSETFSHKFEIDDLFAMQLTCGVASRRLPSLEAEAREQCTKRVRERLEQLTSSELDYRPEVLFAVAG
jgi:SAM-dependent methyltransferase